MMKKVISLVFGLLIGLAVWAQGTADTSASAKDSVSIGSHTEFSATKSADNVTKAQGDSAYMRNDYASAIQIYESLLKKGEAAEVYYNLGNSYYKADDIAKAILNYERALLLQPGNADIRANLEIARSKTIDKVVSVPDIFFVAWVKSLTNCLSVDAWAKLGIVFFILLLISFSLFFFSKQIIWKKSGFIAGIHPTLPSSKRISFHSRMELSLISILCPSCRTNKPVPLSLGVLRTVTLGDKTIASFLSSNSLFCSEAKILLNTVNTKNRIPASAIEVI